MKTLSPKKFIFQALKPVLLSGISREPQRTGFVVVRRELGLRKTGFILSEQTMVIVELTPFSGGNSSAKTKRRLFAKTSNDGKLHTFSIPLTPLEGKAEETSAVLNRLGDEAESNLSRDF